ncbi:MAG: nitrous oxide reductase accessory protein NosL [Candidatus Scalindua sp.]|nr:nitrous oxide reductase accessory protein NosL [Candidatus Scalindua sp.]
MKYWKKALFILVVFAFTLAIVAFYSSNEMVSAQGKSSDSGHHDSAHHHDASHHTADMVKCPLCGMGIEGNENTDYQITFADGKTVSYLCPHCGLWEHAKHKDKIKSVRARDFISGEWKDVTTMYMLSNSSAVPACSPSWIAFGSKTDVEKFQKGFGGTIYTFEEALKVRGAQPLGH